MRTKWWTLALLGTPLVAALAARPAVGQNDRVAAVTQSDIIFVGTVAKVGAVSLADVAASPRTVVVRVDEVIEKPSAVVLATGDSVTVEVRDPSSFQPGQQGTFYTNGWIFGQGVAVREVGYEKSGAQMSGGIAQQKDSILRVRQQVNDAELQARLQGAKMVVVGRVEAVRPANLTAAGGRPGPVTEHDPEWQEAVIHVETAIKGAQRGQRVVVRFPGSLDIAWHGVPKFSRGQEGTFLLNPDTLSGSPKAMTASGEVPAYMALTTQDVLPKQAAQRVRSLSKP